MTSWLTKGLPRQFAVMWQNIRCSILFHATTTSKRNLRCSCRRRTTLSASPSCRAGVLQHVKVHPARSSKSSQPVAAQGGLRDLPRRLLIQRSGDPREVSRADALGTLIEKLVSADVNLSPKPVLNGDGSIKHPGLDNHAMGTIFEELVRRFNEENNEEAGERARPAAKRVRAMRE